MATPSWSAARNGLPGDTNAVNKSAQIDQMLGIHGMTPVYTGTAVVSPSGTGSGTDDPASFFGLHLDTFDYSQPFTMSGTNVGRVQIPFLPVGNGADVKVSLCQDASGVPGTVVASTVIPASWITAFAQVRAIPIPSPDATVILEDNTNPLSAAQFNPVVSGAWQTTTWTSPAVGSDGGAGNPSETVSGDWFITASGTNPSGDPVNSVFTVSYPGSGFQLGNTTPQPVLPQALGAVGVVTTADNIVVVGGINSAGQSVSSVYVAPWDPSVGVIGAWSVQTVLPKALGSVAIGSFGETIYVMGGQDNTPVAVNNTYFATLDNGQITAWTAGPALPLATEFGNATVIGDYLFYYGGVDQSNNVNPNVFYMPLNADGSMGDWLKTPMPIPIVGFNVATTDTAFYQIGGFTNGDFTADTTASQSLSVGPDGIAPFYQQTFPFGSIAAGGIAFNIDVGQWQVFLIVGQAYFSAPLYKMPYISVPLVASGLTSGNTYHVVLQQQGGDGLNFLRSCQDFHSLPGNPNPLDSPRGTNTWHSFSAGNCIPITVYNQSGGGEILHTWEDNGLRISTLVYATTPEMRLLGIADATQFLDSTVLAGVTTIDYPSIWPGTVWPPLGATEIA